MNYEIKNENILYEKISPVIEMRILTEKLS